MNYKKYCIFSLLIISMLIACQPELPLSPTNAGPVIRAIEDYRYVEEKYFFLDIQYHEYFQTRTDPPSEDQVDVQTVRVFISDYNSLNDIEDQAFRAIAYAFWNNGTPEESLPHLFDIRYKEEATFHELASDNFTAYPEGYIIYEKGRVNPGFTLAVTYKTKSGTTHGDIKLHNQDGLAQLKLIKAKQQRSIDPTWPLAWKNVYDIGERNISPNGLSIHIKKKDGLEPATYYQNDTLFVQILGLNIYRSVNNSIPGWNLTRGHFVFPDPMPFASENLLDIPENFYENANTGLRSEESKYIIEFRRQD